MIIILSPSKSMNMDADKHPDFTQPEFLNKTQTLIFAVRKFSKSELMEFMEISGKLAELNRQRFKDWSLPFTPNSAKQAMFAFTGDVYDGLDAPTLKKRDIIFSQNNLRILSGLYGLLKPLDLIQPYRLEMGRSLQTREAKNLYEFWRTTVTKELNQIPGKILINLASQEYFKAIDKQVLDKQVITPLFKDEKNGSYKIISFFAKKARGSMARYLIENRMKDEADLCGFSTDGYQYNVELSKPNFPTFTRTERNPVAK